MKSLSNRFVRIKFVLIFILIISSCKTRNLIYLSDLDFDKVYSKEIQRMEQVKIQQGDLMRISLSSLQPELNSMFNDPSEIIDFNKTAMDNINSEGFLVDDVGEINVPTIGKVKIAGLTKTEATKLIEDKLREFIVDPVVSMRFVNFKVTVIGEVNNPSTFYVQSERLSIFEALGLAGDMTEFGLRENVLVIRESEGERTISKVNFNYSDLLDSPFYYLRQNDIVYVQPDRLKAVKASTNERNMVILGLLVSVLIPVIWIVGFNN
jgi:polysaccharide biosynthesis/export protein